MSDLYSSQYDPKGRYPRIFGQTALVPGIPLLSGAGMLDVFAEEKQVFADARKLQSFYPEIAREIQLHVEEVCDQLEYEGSRMFDEYPDRIMVLRLVDKVKEQMKDFSEEELPEKIAAGEEGLQEMTETAAGGERTSKTGVIQQAGRRQPPPKRGNDWLGDLIQVVLLDEMHRRRCRHRRCRNRSFLYR